MPSDNGALRWTRRGDVIANGKICFWQVGLAHFGGLIWPTPGTLKVKRTEFRSAGA